MGNLHGSVVLGVGLAGLYGLASLWSAIRARSNRLGPEAARAAALCIGAPLCLAASPYGFEGLAYYGNTLLDPAFRSVIREWQPVTSIGPLAVPYFAVAIAVVWILGRSGARPTSFESLALLALLASGIGALRNVVWFALAVLVLLPPIATRAFGHPALAPRRPRLNVTIFVVAFLAVAVAGVIVAGQPRSWFVDAYDGGALDVVAQAATAEPDLRVFADTRFGDWLLWHRPRLRGRIAYDARLELLSRDELRALSRLSVVRGTDYAAPVRGFGLLVLDPRRRPEMTRALLGRDDIRQVFRGKDVVVARQLPDPRP